MICAKILAQLIELTAPSLCVLFRSSSANNALTISWQSSKVPSTERL